MNPGDRVYVHYAWQPAVLAEIIEPEDAFGWVEIEQITDYEDAAERPRFLALASMCTKV